MFLFSHQQQSIFSPQDTNSSQVALVILQSRLQEPIFNPQALGLYIHHRKKVNFPPDSTPAHPSVGCNHPDQAYGEFNSGRSPGSKLISYPYNHDTTSNVSINGEIHYIIKLNNIASTIQTCTQLNTASDDLIEVVLINDYSQSKISSTREPDIATPPPVIQKSPQDEIHPLVFL